MNSLEIAEVTNTPHHRVLEQAYKMLKSLGFKQTRYKSYYKDKSGIDRPMITFQQPLKAMFLTKYLYNRDIKLLHKLLSDSPAKRKPGIRIINP